MGYATKSIVDFGPAMETKARDPQLIADLLKATIRWLARGDEPWPLFLFGDVGAGKTCAGLAIGDMAHEAVSYYCGVPELCDLLIEARQGRRHWSTGYKRTVLDVWKGWENAGVTILDELGARDNVSDHHHETVKRAIDSREGKPSVCISNLSIKDLTSIYDDRIASRLASGTVFRLTGDRRLQKATD